MVKGFFGSLFSKKELPPVSPEDIRNRFLRALEPLTKIEIINEHQQFVLQNLYVTPLIIFDFYFFDKTKNDKTFLNLLEHVEINNGAGLAQITQGITLWYLEQKYKNDDNFRNEIEMPFKQIETFINRIYGKDNLTLQFLNEMRTKFDGKTVHPIEWNMYYVYAAYDLLIIDQKKNHKALFQFDSSPILKAEFQAYFTNTIIRRQKEILEEFRSYKN